MKVRVAIVVTEGALKAALEALVSVLWVAKNSLRMQLAPVMVLLEVLLVAVAVFGKVQPRILFQE